MLDAPMRDGALRIEPAQEEHREPLRVACAEDREIWAIYMSCFVDDGFDPAFDAFFIDPAARAFVIFDGDQVVGMSSYLYIDERHRTLEIGRTYLVPRVRGTGFNGRVKRLMLDSAFAEGFRRVELRVDTRNKRSMAAVAKLGGVYEGTLRRHLVTWTGHERDTAVFSLLAEEWGQRS